MSEPWPVEFIPDDDVLYMRVHVNHVANGELLPGAFIDHEGAMSANWQKYCPTPEEARAKARNPMKNGVVSAIVQNIRKVPMVVEHSPDHVRCDRSHTSIIGEKNAETRTKLYDAFSWCLKIGE